MIRTSEVKIEGRKSHVLARLSVSISKAVSLFHCALKYRMTNLLEWDESLDSTSPVR